MVRQYPGEQQAVLQELTRGLELVTELPVVESKSPGWIGLRCHSEEMAIWMLRAIIVENVFVRRETDCLYFPAGPQFQLHGEIKNIITVAAKTHHYWAEHMAATMQPDNQQAMLASANGTSTTGVAATGVAYAA